MICLNKGCQRHVGDMCHIQEAARRWRKALSLGRLCLATTSCLTWDRQPAGEHRRHCTLQRHSPVIWQKVCNGLQRDIARGQCSPASRLTLAGARGRKGDCVKPRSFSNLIFECGPGLGLFRHYAFAFEAW